MNGVELQWGGSITSGATLYSFETCIHVLVGLLEIDRWHETSLELFQILVACLLLKQKLEGLDLY